MTGLFRHLLHAIGWISLGLGVVGVALPLVPTVPFVLVAAAIFLRTSERSHMWLMSHPVLGAHLRDYNEGRGVRPQVKLLAVIGMWASILTSVVFFVDFRPVEIMLLVMAVGVTVHIVLLPTAEPSE